MSTTPPTPAGGYDFIIVGSGAGGGPLACRLARAGAKVLVLEAGDWVSQGVQEEITNVPAFHAVSTESKEIGWNFFVKHYDEPSIPSRGAAGERLTDSKWHKDSVPEKTGIFYPRCSTVGGCTVHNAMITITGPSSDWDAIAKLTGDDSWRGEAMRDYFQRLEHCDYLKPANLFDRLRNAAARLVAIGDAESGRHGFEGWLHTSFADPKLAVKDLELVGAILAAFKAANVAHLENVEQLVRSFLGGGISASLDPNDWNRMNNGPEGLAFIPISVNKGVRSSPREFLREVQQESLDGKLGAGCLHIQTNSLATEILFDQPPLKAVGIKYLHGSKLYRAHKVAATEAGTPGEVRVRPGGEVILAGGAFNTPQLLMLSGIGPAEHLRQNGITVRLDLPGVGANLQDRYEVGVISEMKQDFKLLHGLAFGPTDPPDDELVEWRQNKTGLYTSNGAVLGILKKSRPDLDAPDLFIFALPGSFRGYVPGYSEHILVNPDPPHEARHNILTWAILKAHTKNRGGTVRLRSSDPLMPPEVNFKYFDDGTDKDEDDLKSVVSGVRFVRSIAGNLSGKFVTKNEEWPGGKLWSKSGRLVTDREEDLEDFVRQEAWGHHASCTCAIGADGDPSAVLNSDFKVRGVTGLRVVDASVFPRIPGVFVVSNIYMVSEKASDVILQQHREIGNGK